VKAEDIIHTEVKAFANYANERSIPSLVDGLKTSQRKVIACAWELKLNGPEKQMKVSQLGPRATDMYQYKHGDASILATTVGLAQTFPGSNNLNLLFPEGQFGNRINRGASAPRYISTYLSKHFFDLFEKEDFEIMDFVYEEGDRLEPVFMLPVLPLVLINGSDGTGNGFKSFILPHNPKDIATAIKQIVAGRDLKPLVPWVRGFTGTVLRDPNTDQITFIGKYEKQDSNTCIVTDLPPRYDAGRFKAVLNDLIDSGVIKDYDNESNEDKWRWVIDVPRNFWNMDNEQILNKLKLVQRETQNIVVWNEDAKLLTFKNVENLLRYWVKHRLEVLKKRKIFIINSLASEINWLTTKRKFIILWNRHSDALIKLSKTELREKLTALGSFSDEDLKRLLAMSLMSLTLDEVKDLEELIAKLTKQKSEYEKTTAADMIAVGLKPF
jgi:DNA topoisomerase-2